MDKLKLIECPRDAMQGLHEFIGTEVKAKYINGLLGLGFDTIDFGSFVSPKAIPQMKDTAQVLSKLELSNTSTHLLAIVANQRGAEDASKFEEIRYLGYPFSISETFQQRNTNASIDESLGRVEEIQKICVSNQKELVVYISMAFGNPYGDDWSSDIAAKWTERLYRELDVKIIQLSDTIGCATNESISQMFGELVPEFTNVEIGAHLHSTPDTIYDKVEAAYTSGCRRFDGAIKGLGGCPMAKDDLTGTMATEVMLDYFNKNNINHSVDMTGFAKSLAEAQTVFPQ